MERTRRKSNKKIVVVLVVAGILALIGMLAAGYWLGKSKTAADLAEKTRELSESVQEKTDFIQKLNNLYSSFNADAETIDKSGIDEYVNKLKALMSETSETEIKSALESYLGSWEKLQAVYDEKDNEEIMKAFEEIKAAAVETGEQIQKILDQKIKSAADAL